jgi:class 3 adenylate cyclase
MSIKTVVELDLVGYSDVARVLQENLDTEAIARLNTQIQEFVEAGLKATGAEREQVLLKTTGDGAILAFDRSEDAHRFAVGVHRATQEHNIKRSLPFSKRWFRIGIATGDLYREPNGDIAGTVIADAVRLEAAGLPGQIITDATTFDSLPADLQTLYGSEEIVAGKRDERFAARRSTVVSFTVDVRSNREPPTNLVHRRRFQMPQRFRLVLVTATVVTILARIFFNYALPEAPLNFRSTVVVFGACSGFGCGVVWLIGLLRLTKHRTKT